MKPETWTSVAVMAEDNRTRRALDELADLFLTGPATAPPSAPTSTPGITPVLPVTPGNTPGNASAGNFGGQKPVDEPAHQPERAAPPGRAVADDGLGGPAPIRLGPKTSAQSTTSALRPHAPLHPPPSESVAPNARDAAAEDVDAPADQDVAARPAVRAGGQTPHLRLHRAEADVVPSNGPSNGQLSPGLRGRHGEALRAALLAALEQSERTATPGGAGAATLEAGAADDADPRDREQASAAPRVTVEVVLMGNLPGLSGPWLIQYAQSLAQLGGTVAVLHVDDERVDVELVESTDQPQVPGRVAPGTFPGAGRPAQDLVERLDGLVRAGTAPVRTVLVHVEPASRAVEMQRLRSLERWTLVSGADDAAVVAAYQLLKQLAAADDAIADKRLGLMVMGSDGLRARGAVDKLSAAAASFLGTPVRLAGWRQQMVPVNLRQVGRFVPTEPLWRRLSAWLTQWSSGPAIGAEQRSEPAAASRAKRSGEPAEVEQVAAQAPASDAADAAPVLSAAAEVPLEAPPEVSMAASKPTDERSESVGSPGKPSAPAASPAPSPATGNAQPETQPDPDLATFVTTGTGSLAGGMALEARCPHQPRTQLVLDQDGRLHLLRRHDPSPGSAPGNDLDGLRSAVVDLLEARRWVREHLQLIQLTQRQCRFAPDAEPHLHLFTSRADLAVGLVARLGPVLTLHLLQSVQVGDQQTWFCTPLGGGRGNF